MRELARQWSMDAVRVGWTRIVAAALLNKGGVLGTEGLSRLSVYPHGLPARSVPSYSPSSHVFDMRYPNVCHGIAPQGAYGAPVPFSKRRVAAASIGLPAGFHTGGDVPRTALPRQAGTARVAVTRRSWCPARDWLDRRIQRNGCQGTRHSMHLRRGCYGGPG